jgi:hypothetical protein
MDNIQWAPSSASSLSPSPSSAFRSHPLTSSSFHNSAFQLPAQMALPKPLSPLIDINTLDSLGTNVARTTEMPLIGWNSSHQVCQIIFVTTRKIFPDADINLKQTVPTFPTHQLQIPANANHETLIQHGNRAYMNLLQAYTKLEAEQQGLK